MFCDGANAFLVTTEARARKLGITKMVYPTAYAEVTNFNGNQSAADITETGFSKSRPASTSSRGSRRRTSACSSPMTISPSR